MTFTAAWGRYDENDPGAGTTRTVATPEQVDELVRALSEENAYAARIIHDARPPVRSPLSGEPVPDHALWAGVWQGYGYLMHVDPAHDLSQPVGDPASPVYHSDSDEFEAGTGIPVETFTEALKEFLATAQRPTRVEWRAVFPDIPTEAALHAVLHLAPLVPFDGLNLREEVMVRTVDDIPWFVERLHEAGVVTASVRHRSEERPSPTVSVEGERGHLHHLFHRSTVPIETLTEALEEFLVTAQRPTCVAWHELP